MTTATALVIPALRDVRDAQATVADTFQAHYAVTPDGPHRPSLRQHADDAREHLRRLDEPLEDFQPRRPVLHPLNLARQATRVFLLPLEAAVGIPAALLPAGGETLARRLLRNAEDEYTRTSRAVTVCRAGERIARETMGRAGAGLLASIRAQDTRILQQLDDSLDERAEEVLDEETAGATLSPGAAGAVRAVAGGLRGLWDAAVMAGAGAGEVVARAFGRTPATKRVQQQVKGAAAEGEQLPLPGYRTLDAEQITARLPHLSQAELAVIDGYEGAHARRAPVLDTIVSLRRTEPWPGYETMNVSQIRERLWQADPTVARKVLDYERDHEQRPTITTAAERAAGAPCPAGPAIW